MIAHKIFKSFSALASVVITASLPGFIVLDVESILRQYLPFLKLGNIDV